MDPKDVDTLVESARKRFASRGEVLFNGQWGQMSAAKAIVEMRRDGNIDRALNDRALAGLDTGRRILGDAWVNNFLVKDAVGYTEVQRGIKGLIVGETLNYTDKPLQQTLRELQPAIKNSGTNPDTVTRQSVMTLIGIIKHPETTPRVAESAARQLFGEGNKDFYAKADPKTQDAMWSNMTAPDTTKAFMALRDKGRGDIWAVYNQFVDRTMNARISREAADVKQKVIDKRSPWVLNYDPETFTFEVVPFKPSDDPRNPTPPGAEPRQGDKLEIDTIATKLNLTTSHYVAVRKAMNEKPEKINERLTNIFVTNGMDLEYIGFAPKAKDFDEGEKGLVPKGSESPGNKEIITGPVPAKKLIEDTKALTKQAEDLLKQIDDEEKALLKKK
jgi:hypothetical protein